MNNLATKNAKCTKRGVSAHGGISVSVPTDKKGTDKEYDGPDASQHFAGRVGNPMDIAKKGDNL